MTMKARTGVGTIIAFNTTRVGYFLDFERNGTKVSRIIDPAVAHALAEAYGIRERSGGRRASLASLKGACFRYRETSQGMIVAMEVLAS